jgi:hypothetical protein
MPFSRDLVPRKRDRSLFVRRLFDGSDVSIVFDQSTAKIYIINPPTRLVWNLCDGRHSWGNIRDILQASVKPDGSSASRFTDRELEETLQALCSRDWVFLSDKSHPLE